MPLASAEMIIDLFSELFPEGKGREECRVRLAQKMDASRMDDEHLRQRLAIFKKLRRLPHSPADLIRLIQSHDAILKCVEIISDEDITGYHHSVSTGALSRWIRVSTTVDDFLKIIYSKTPEGTARVLAPCRGTGRPPSRSFPMTAL